MWSKSSSLRAGCARRRGVVDITRCVIHDGAVRLMHCVDDVCDMRAKEDGRSRSSPSDREAILSLCAMVSFEGVGALAEYNGGSRG
jgi:hypothetical protein